MYEGVTDADLANLIAVAFLAFGLGAGAGGSVAWWLRRRDEREAWFRERRVDLAEKFITQVDSLIWNARRAGKHIAGQAPADGETATSRLLQAEAHLAELERVIARMRLYFPTGRARSVPDAASMVWSHCADGLGWLRRANEDDTAAGALSLGFWTVDLASIESAQADFIDAASRSIGWRS